ncbi:CRTAC1 family protein [Paludisphaera soli]|uniref:CRTAC1 family protein n=1 Tax=Paludisphaera soli TaxID=2712865 RepID=UPI0013E9CD2E|nr:CRTAC1 family protein [Paludisphaera soli]
MQDVKKGRRRKGVGATLFVGLAAAGTIGAGVRFFMPGPEVRPLVDRPLPYQRRAPLDTSGFSMIVSSVEPWDAAAGPAEIRERWLGVGERAVKAMERHEASGAVPLGSLIPHYVARAMLRHAEGDPKAAAGDLEKARALTDREDALAVRHLSSVTYFQGVTALRQGENDNCIMCRGDSSCILPIAESARHVKPAGSTAAIGYFTDLLERFPDDLEAAWLLNLAHMTLGQYPDQVDPRFVLDLSPYMKSEFDIGRFRDVGADAGVNRLDQAGGAVMEDFDGDGLLDLFVTSFDPKQAAGFYHNNGDGTFDDRSGAAGLQAQFGGLYCVQADYDNDGLMDVFIPRGAWLRHPMRPSLMRNTGGGVFEDVTDRAGLAAPMNSNSASWVDYDNDGDVDLFVCEERLENRLYRNNGDGTFEDVAGSVGLLGSGRVFCKGACWADFDNDGDPDLFVNYLNGLSAAYRNDGGTFVEATEAMGVRGPMTGFSCWAFDYDNDGWEDVFATCYDRSLGDVVKGLIGRPHSRYPNRLYRNDGGRFVDQTKAAGLDGCYAAMGSNFADFDNDGFLDFYLGTGEPSFATLIPNRMFKNVDGKRFAEITASAGVGHLQKGHAVACGDYDRDGDVDLFVQVGGAVDGDRYHNVLFRNPGQGRRSLTMKLVGEKSNRAALGARIKVTTGGPNPRTIHRTVGSGSSFGANALEQTVGLGDAESAALIEVRWPASGCVQTFRDVPAGRRIEVVEFAPDYRTLDGAGPAR